MGRMTFVFEYEDGKEPEIKNDMEFMSGRVVAASDADLVHACMVMDQKIDVYKEREKKLIDKLNETGEPLTKKELMLFLLPVLLVALLSFCGIIFGFPALISFLNRHYGWW